VSSTDGARLGKAKRWWAPMACGAWRGRQLDAASASEPPARHRPTRPGGHWSRNRRCPRPCAGARVDVWLGPQLHAVAYPVRGGDWLNVVVIAESAPAGDARDWDQGSSIAALEAGHGPQLRRPAGRCSMPCPAGRAWTLSDRAPVASAADMAPRARRAGGRCRAPDGSLPRARRGPWRSKTRWRWPMRSANGSAARSARCTSRAYADARWARNATGAGAGPAQRRDLPCHGRGAPGAREHGDAACSGAKLLDQPWLLWPVERRLSSD